MEKQYSFILVIFLYAFPIGVIPLTYMVLLDFFKGNNINDALRGFSRIKKPFAICFVFSQTVLLFSLIEFCFQMYFKTSSLSVFIACGTLSAISSIFGLIGLKI